MTREKNSLLDELQSQLTPLTELERVTKQKLIPYFATEMQVAAVERQNPKVFNYDELPFNISSHHIHEAAHGIAESLFQSVKVRSEKEKILKAMICESFANSIDASMINLASSPIHLFFAIRNSYARGTHIDKKHYDKVVKLLGFHSSFQLIFFSYLYANFLFKTITAEALQDVLLLIQPSLKLTKEELKACRVLFEKGFGLNTNFRLKSNYFYLTQMGVKKDIFRAMDFDFIEMIKTDSRFAEVISQLSLIAEYGNA